MHKYFDFDIVIMEEFCAGTDLVERKLSGQYHPLHTEFFHFLTLFQ